MGVSQLSWKCMHSDSLPPGTRLSSESVDAVTNRSGACEYITGEADAHLVVATHSELSPPPQGSQHVLHKYKLRHHGGLTSPFPRPHLAPPLPPSPSSPRPQLDPHLIPPPPPPPPPPRPLCWATTALGKRAGSDRRYLWSQLRSPGFTLVCAGSRTCTRSCCRPAGR